MKKRTLAALLALVMLLSLLAGCGSSDAPASDSPASEPPAQSDAGAPESEPPAADPMQEQIGRAHV